MNTTPSVNFAYLAHHDARLVALATQAEEHFAGDPTVTLFKLRQFGEVLARHAAAKVGMFVSDEGQQQLIDRLAKQVKLETVVDRASLDAGQFKTDGGFARLNKVFDGKLESLLGELADEVWKDAG